MGQIQISALGDDRFIVRCQGVPPEQVGELTGVMMIDATEDTFLTVKGSAATGAFRIMAVEVSVRGAAAAADIALANIVNPEEWDKQSADIMGLTPHMKK